MLRCCYVVVVVVGIVVFAGEILSIGRALSCHLFLPSKKNRRGNANENANGSQIAEVAEGRVDARRPDQITRSLQV